jgi:3,4-dihydroxy 2-butanone 4-phosphate synthase / GTP cyclohydrolase II
MSEATAGERPVHGTLVALGARPLATTRGDFTVHVFQNLATRDYALAVACGSLTTDAPLLARVHSSCVTSESYGGCDCDCAQQLDAALAQIARAKRGILVYLMQEGRGAGFVAKARDRMIVQASEHRLSTFDAYEQMGLARDCRRYEDVGFVRRLLGLRAPFELLTNNPEKTAALEAAGIPIAAVRPLRHPASSFNVHYLRAKSRLGHTLAADGVASVAALPEPVSRREPRPLPQAPQLVHMASYLLPVLLRGERDDPGPHWFWAHVYLDVAVARPRVVLTYGRPAAEPLLVRVQPEALLERFALRDGGTHRRRWNATVRAFVRAGAGCAVWATLDPLSGADPGAASGGADETALLLLAQHAPAGRVRPLVAPGPEQGFEPELRARLARHGIESAPALVLDGDA